MLVFYEPGNEPQQMPDPEPDNNFPDGGVIVWLAGALRLGFAVGACGNDLVASAVGGVLWTV